MDKDHQADTIALVFETFQPALLPPPIAASRIPLQGSTAYEIESVPRSSSWNRWDAPQAGIALKVSQH
jgi:hypothetical protein